MTSTVRRAWPRALASLLVVTGVALLLTGGAALCSVASAPCEPVPVGEVVPGPLVLDDQQLWGAVLAVVGLPLLSGLTGHHRGARGRTARRADA